MLFFNKLSIFALLVAAAPAMACKIKLINDNTLPTKNVRVLINDSSAKDLSGTTVSGRALRKFGAKKIEPSKKGSLGSKYKMNVLYIYEKQAKNTYALIAIINQTANAANGQEIVLNLSDLKANKFDTNLLQVTLK